MNLVKSGDVMVIDSRGDVTKAVLGGVSTEEMARRGLEAIIVDGAVRDRAHITRLGLPVFARAVHPSPPTFSGPGEINVPVCCGGVVIEPGDIVVADEEGIVVIPWRDLDAVLPGSRRCRRDRGRVDRSHRGGRGRAGGGDGRPGPRRARHRHP
jgi:regulator of RNase E activity RraA